MAVGEESKAARKQEHGQERARARVGKSVGAREGRSERAHVKKGREMAGGRGGKRETEGERQSKKGWQWKSVREHMAGGELEGECKGRNV